MNVAARKFSVNPKHTNNNISKCECGSVNHKNIRDPKCKFYKSSIAFKVLNSNLSLFVSLFN